MAVLGKHIHSYAVDPSGNGQTGYIHNHYHEIINGVVQEAVIPGKDGSEHIHNISGLQISSSQKVVNIKIKDYPSAENFKKVNINIAQLTDMDPGGTFLEFNVCVGKDGYSRFAFDVDVERALRDSTFGSMLDNKLDSSTKSEIMALSRIENLRILRNRIDVVSPEEEIVSSMQASTYGVLASALNDYKSSVDSSSVRVGSISEMTMNYASSIRTFTGVDYSLPEEGTYEYAVKIDMTDGILSYLNQKLTQLSSAISSAQSWQMFSSSSDHTDSTTGKFTSQYTQKVLDDYGTSKTPIESSIAVYAGILSVCSPNIDATSVIKVLYPLINTISGSTKGINMIVELLQDLDLKIRNILGDRISSGQSSAEKSSITTKDKFYMNKIQIEKFFSNNQVVANNPSKTGYDYLAVPDSDEYGLKIISTENYDIRITNEINKFSSTEIVSPAEDTVSLIEATDKLSAISNLTTSQSFMLSPEIIFAGESSLNLQTTDLSRWEPSMYGEVVSQLRLSNLLDEASASTSSSGPDDILSILGVTIEEYSESPAEGYSGTTAVDESGHFSEGDSFVGDLTKDSELIDASDASEVSEDYSGMSSILAAGLIGSQEGILSNNPDNYDLSNPSNLFYSITTQEALNLPLQVKTLFYRGLESIKSIPSEIPLDSQDFIDLFLMNYNQLVQVESLSYKDTNTGTKQAVWSPLTMTKMQQSTKNPIRCRIRRYSNSTMMIDPNEEIQAVIYDDHFIIKSESVASSKTNKRRTNSTITKASKFVDVQNGLIRNGKSVVISTKKPTTAANSSINIK